MKKIFLLLIILSVIVASSCSFFDKSRSKNPEVVVKKFLYYMNKHDYEKAKKYCNLKTQRILDFMDQLIAISGQDINAFDGNVKIIKTEVNGDKAICYYKSFGKDQQVNLEKENERWLIDMKKEAPPKK
jgi:hypothetical protein